MAATQKPAFISASLSASAQAASPTISGCIGVVEAVSGTPSAATAARNRSVRLCSRSRRQLSCCTSRISADLISMRARSPAMEESASRLMRSNNW